MISRRFFLFIIHFGNVQTFPLAALDTKVSIFEAVLGSVTAERMKIMKNRTRIVAGRI